ncbi:MAG: potassium transporter TrkA [Actinomycetota bacterium]|nr:potassium transporter TrkA [Actinomycetota bacterium]
MPNRSHPLKDRLRYRLDSSLSSGPASVIRWLAIITIALIVAAAAVIALARVPTGSERHGFIQSLWLTLTRALDAGTIGNDAEASWRFRVVGLVVTIGGIFIVSALIGLLTNAIDQKLEQLRKGKSPVIESGHTLILGWSAKLFTLIAELVEANSNQRDPCIVVMALRDKIEMEDEIRARVADPGRTRIVCRTGEPSNLGDLAIVQPAEAKVVIILSPEDSSPDAQVIKTILALMNLTGDSHVLGVAEFVDDKNARSLRAATGGRILTVVSTEIIARITAQVARQSGLSAVYQELLDFTGDEIYFANEPKLVGRSFADAVMSYETSTIIGLRHADGQIELCPSMTCPIETGDSVIGITADDDTLVLADLAGQVQMDVAIARPRVQDDAMLVIGWNHMAPAVIEQLDHQVLSGSRCHVMYDQRFVERGIVDVPETTNLQVTFSQADTSQPLPIANVLAGQDFKHIVVLCYRYGLSEADSDAMTLVTLLQLRQILGSVPAGSVSIVTEMLDVRDVELARIASADDFVVSERLTSLLLAQLAENPELEKVFAEIFEASTPTEISLRPAEPYLLGEASVAYGELVRRFLPSDELLIGYRKREGGPGQATVVVNPAKSAEVSLAAGDQLVVMSKTKRASVA